MLVLNARNVNDAYAQALHHIRSMCVGGEPLPSRNGPVWRSDCPVTTIYAKPMERVLFDVKRDANPFFHFLESLWMLAGRNDAAFVKTYAANMANYSDDGETLNGAYGFRWRQYFLYDQLTTVLDILKRDPWNRRAVLGMWNPHRDLVDQTSKDLPCNLAVKFFVRLDHGRKVLDMQVFNRSNDIIWGAYGANAVHMSILHEFVASQLPDCGIGRYYQISGDWHAYVDTYNKFTDDGTRFPDLTEPCMYTKPRGCGAPLPLFAGKYAFAELEIFFSDLWERQNFSCQAFKIGRAMRIAWALHKEKKTQEAINVCMERIDAPDWKLACIAWLSRRAPAGTTVTEPKKEKPHGRKED